MLNTKELYYLENPNSNYFTGNYSPNHFPSISFQLWSSKKKAEQCKTGNWSVYDIKSIETNTFIDECLNEFIHDENLDGFDWLLEFENDIFPEMIIEYLNQ